MTELVEDICNSNKMQPDLGGETDGHRLPCSAERSFVDFYAARLAKVAVARLDQSIGAASVNLNNFRNPIGRAWPMRRKSRMFFSNAID